MGGDAGTQGPSLALRGGGVQPRAEVGAPKRTAQCSEYAPSGCRTGQVLMCKKHSGENVGWECSPRSWSTHKVGIQISRAFHHPHTSQSKAASLRSQPIRGGLASQSPPPTSRRLFGVLEHRKASGILHTTPVQQRVGSIYLRARVGWLPQAPSGGVPSPGSEAGVQDAVPGFPIVGRRVSGTSARPASALI